MENLVELEKSQLCTVNGGDGGATAGLIIAVVTFGIYLYNEGHDLVEGVKDGMNGEYNNDPCE